jgi:hypothetical protein
VCVPAKQLGEIKDATFYREESQDALSEAWAEREKPNTTKGEK